MQGNKIINNLEKEVCFPFNSGKIYFEKEDLYCYHKVKIKNRNEEIWRS